MFILFFLFLLFFNEKSFASQIFILDDCEVFEGVTGSLSLDIRESDDLLQKEIISSPLLNPNPSPPMDIPKRVSNTMNDLESLWPRLHSDKPLLLIKDSVLRLKMIESIHFSQKKRQEPIFTYECTLLSEKCYADSVEKLNHSETFEAARDELFQLACAGTFEVIDWFCDPRQGDNFKRLYPEKTVEDFLLRDLQTELNEDAYEYYLDVLFPEKEKMLPVLKEALKRGFSKEAIYTRILWVLYNDINALSSEERGPWIEKFVGIQALGWKKGLVDSIEIMFDRRTLKGLM
ncbi:MAG: hypothetical protein K2X98_03595 [Alphaproteobacteria bacterium]|nr:hypothetical protein [Alphaproteobacteria bacterium]MBX9977313.1 hypothetical protein [Alphaproteobacteria bacterium]